MPFPRLIFLGLPSIGKMENPLFFIENQTSGFNPHDKLPYQESAQIIIRHVSQGIEMAKKANLPEIVIDFIRTHHGIDGRGSAEPA